MASSGVLRRVAIVRTDVSQELSASFIRVTRIGELGTTLAVTSNRQRVLALYTVLRNLLNVLEQVVNKLGLQIQTNVCFAHVTEDIVHIKIRDNALPEFHIP
jgi:hypothetical protein